MSRLLGVRGAALDLTPVRILPPLRRLLLGDAVSVLGTQVTVVAVPLQVYAQTRSAAAVGLVGAGAAVAGLQGAVVAGGLLVVGVTVAIAAAVPRFTRYDAREPGADLAPRR